MNGQRVSTPLSLTDIAGRIIDAQAEDDDFDFTDLAVLAEDLREEGRRDILREIAALTRVTRLIGEDGDVDGHCAFCAQPYIDRDDASVIDHRLDCLWLRAQAVAPGDRTS